MKEVKIISLSGHIGSGKDFIAEIIAREQFGYKHLKLAGLLKYIYCQIKGITLEQLEERKYKEIARPEIITLSLKIKEVFGVHCFCKVIYNQILLELANTNGYKFVISDLRFPYEYLFFRKLGRCSKENCEIDHFEIPGYEVNYQSLYIESDLVKKDKKIVDSEAHYESYLKPNSQGIIFNGTEERYDNQRLVNQLVKFL